MSQNQALEKLHTEHPPESLKHKVGAAVGSHWFELIIILCIFADIGLVFMEMGIDHHFFCIGGTKVDMSREELQELADGGSEAGPEKGPPGVHLLALAPPAGKNFLDGLDELLVPRDRHGLAFLQRALASGQHPAPQGEAQKKKQKAEARDSENAERDGTLMPYKKFKPACLRHVQQLVSKSDRAHTDVHLDQELLQQCELERQYPLTRSDGFEDEQACKDFASMLVAARDDNLRDGSVRGYEYFCRQYYVHKGGEIPEDDTPVSEEPEWGVKPAEIRASEGDGVEKGKESEGEEGEEAEAALVCEDRHGHHSHHMAHTCHFWSVAILSFFMLELLVKIWISPSAFFHNFFHVLDLIVVSVSLFIDTIMVQVVMFFWGESSEGLDIVAILLLTSRLWRIARIIHGIFEVVLAQKEEMDELEHEIMEGREAIEKLQEKIQRLESRSG
jgi:hypothetical protein